MALELIVLPILQRVVGDYVSNLLTQRTQQKTRAEVIAAMTHELDRAHAIGDQVAALAIAVRELDIIVRRDPSLEWSDDFLTVGQVRRGLRRTLPTTAEAIRDLELSVTSRRKELDLPMSDRRTVDPIMDDPDLIPPIPQDHESGAPPDPRDAGSKWNDRLLSLSEETARERQRRQREP